MTRMQTRVKKRLWRVIQFLKNQSNDCTIGSCPTDT
jgi:hypothetical protein